MTPIGAMKVGNGSLAMPMVSGTVQAPTMQGRMRTSGGLKLSAPWAHLINHLVGKQVVHPGEDLGDLSVAVKMA